MGSLVFTTKKCYLCSAPIQAYWRNGRKSPQLRIHYTLGRDKPICQNCYAKQVVYPRRMKQQKWREYYRKHNQNQNNLFFRFRDKQRAGTFRKITGYCERCPNNIHDGSCKLTHMHHWVYIIIFPWFGREELCVSCHSKTVKRGYHGRYTK